VIPGGCNGKNHRVNLCKGMTLDTSQLCSRGTLALATELGLQSRADSVEGQVATTALSAPKRSSCGARVSPTTSGPAPETKISPRLQREAPGRLLSLVNDPCSEHSATIPPAST